MSHDESGFSTRVQDVLARVAEALEDAGADDLDIELTDGVLTIEDETKRVWVINRHVPLRQIWVSSPISGAAHFAFDDTSGRWLATRGGPPLDEVLAVEMGALAGVTLDFTT